MNRPQGEERDEASWRLAVLPAVVAAGVLVASWLKGDLPNNDFERFDDLRLTFLFFTLLAVACLGYAKLALEPRLVPGRVLAAGFAAAAALLLSAYPVGSKDVFLYAFTGKVWSTYGANPLATAPSAFPNDPWQPYTQVIWADQPSPYGPLFLWQARLLAVLSAERLFVAVWLHKLAATLALVALVVVARRMVGPQDSRLLLLAWNPLLLFESAGNGHNDAFVAFLLVAAVWLHRSAGTGRTLLAPAALALGVWTKWYALLFLPAFAVAARRERGGREMRRWLLSSAVIVAATGAILLAPLAEAVPGLAARLAAHENLRQVFPLQLSPLLRLLLEALNAAGAYGGGRGWLWFDVVRLSLFGLAAAATLTLQWRGRIDLVRSLFLLATAFTLFAVSVLWPWHLEVPVALALLADGRGFRLAGLALTLVALLSYFFTFAWAAAAIGLVAAALSALRAGRRLPVA
jgi:hypothetical protein